VVNGTKYRWRLVMLREKQLPEHLHTPFKELHTHHQRL